jgi:tetratricopeptide (TPR) repeat protein
LTSGESRSILLSLLAAMLITSLSCSTKPEEPEEIYTRKRQADALMLQAYSLTDALNFDLATASFDEALDIYAQLDNRDGVINALLGMGRNKRMTGKTEDARELYDHALSMAAFSQNPRLMRSVLNHQADLALRSGDPVKALDLLADTDPPVLDGRERSAQLRLKGAARYELGAEDEAIELLVKAVEVAESAEEVIVAAQAYYKLASIASLGARFDEAEAWALKALEADKTMEYGPGIAADLRALAIISAKSGRNDIAEDYYRRSWLAWRGLERFEDAESARMELELLIGRPVTVP